VDLSETASEITHSTLIFLASLSRVDEVASNGSLVELPGNSVTPGFVSPPQHWNWLNATQHTDG